MVGHAYDGLPDEACGLLAGPPGTDRATAFYPVNRQVGQPRVHDRPGPPPDRPGAEADGLEVVGVMHSHTHTEAYPSPTDVAQAPDPTWHYVIVSLRPRRRCSQLPHRRRRDRRGEVVVDGQSP